MLKHALLLALAACDIGPRVDDIQIDADTPPPATSILPAGSAVPSIGTNAELVNQIRANDGLPDAALMMNGGVIARGTGKSAGATVRFWNFGPSPVQDNFAVASSLYILGRLEDTTFTPLADHPPLIDTICGDVRYSAIRRVQNVPVSATYKGELITSVEALDEAIERGLVGDPVPDGTWVNVPVVVPGTLLDVGGDPLAATQIFGRGYRVEVFVLGTSLGRQPLRSGSIPIGQAAGLQTGVATGTPPTLPTAVDPQPVFQFAVPTTAPGATFSYSPLAADVTVRLATNVAPAAITSDVDLFRRAANGAITAFVVENVASFTIGTTVTNLQLQFVEGSP